MSIEEIEAKFNELENDCKELEVANDEFNEFIASLQEMVYYKEEF